ncbi:MAG: DUF1269 domain-containing protein [Syntrophomonadaceae bacterium]|nr:DUF1269 domain-containing protein [Syntrophomonadaceae bacterium]
MAKLVISTFGTRSQAEEAVRELRQRGFDQEISVVAKEDVARGDTGAGRSAGRRDMEIGGEDLTGGAATGGILGGLAGLAAGAGALAIPGLGPLFAIGPITGLLTGAATGGIAGSLVDWGLPEAEGKQIEQDIRSGKIMVAVTADDNRISDAAMVLRKHGADQVKTR